MSKIKTIVAAVSLGGQDDSIVARASQLCAQHGARLVLVHVMEAMAPADAMRTAGLDAATVRSMIESEATDQLEALVSKTGFDIRQRSIVVEGRPSEVIISLVHDQKADLVVIGPGKRTKLREKVLGSTADSVVRSSPVPVLVAKIGTAEPYRRVVVAADTSPQSLAASTAAHLLAPEATIEHVHVVEMPLSFKQALLRAGTSSAEIAAYRQARIIGAREQLTAAFADADGCPLPKLRLLQGDPRKALVRWTRNRRTDLIALGTHGRAAVAQIVLGSAAQNVLRAATCDVLIVSR